VIARVFLVLAVGCAAVAAAFVRRCAHCGCRQSRYADPRDECCWACVPTTAAEDHACRLPGKCSSGLHDRAGNESFVPEGRYSVHPDYGARGYVYCRACRNLRRRANGWR